MNVVDMDYVKILISVNVLMGLMDCLHGQVMIAHLECVQSKLKIRF